MRIQNLMPATIFFPYAGMKPNRGSELAPDALSQDVEATRFFDPRLQKDWKAGKIQVFINEADKAILGVGAVDAVRLAGERANEVTVPEVTEQEEVIKEEPSVEEVIVEEHEAPIVEQPEAAIEDASTEQEDQEDDSVPVSLADLNAPKKRGRKRKVDTSAILAKAAQKVNGGDDSEATNSYDLGEKSTPEEISAHLKGLV